MSVNRDIIYVLVAAIFIVVGSFLLRVSQNRSSRLQQLVRITTRVVIVLALALGLTVFCWCISSPPRKFLRTPEFYLAAAFLGGSAFWWFRPVAARTRRGVSQFGYPFLLVALVGGGQITDHQFHKGKSDSLQATLRAATGQSAPEIQFLDASGAPHKISEFKGRVVLLNFGATTCGPCVHEMPDLSKLQRKYQSRGFVLVYLSSEEPNILARFFRGRNLDGINGRLVPQYPVPSFYAPGEAWPISILIDRNGVVRDAWLGAPPLDFTANKIEQEL